MSKARDIETGEIVALKRIRFKLDSGGMPIQILREIALLRQLQRYQQPHIVR